MTAFRLNLEQQKKRAKDLLRAAKAGEKHASARIGTTPKLADAQLVIARDLRFASWAQLKAHIASMEHQRAAIAQTQPAPDGDMKTLHVRCGHDIRATLQEAGFVGDFHPHVTPYCQGPVTRGPDRHELMARFIVEGFAEILADSRRLDY